MKQCVVIHPDIWKWMKPLYEEWLEGETEKLKKAYTAKDRKVPSSEDAVLKEEGNE